MPNIEQKQAVVDEIKGKLDKALSVVVVDARGLTVDQDTKLRKSLREADIEYRVYKNTMMHLAVEGTQFEGLQEYLKGPSTFVFSYDDATKGAGIISKSLKDLKNLEFKAGIIDKVAYDAQGMKLIAEIPSKEVLISKLLGSFKSPLSAFARVIQAVADEKTA